MLRNRFTIFFCTILILMVLPSQFNVSAASNKIDTSFAGPAHLAQDILDTETPTPTETETVAATETETLTPTETVAITETASPTPTETETVTATITPTATVTPTATPLLNRYVAVDGTNSGNCTNMAAPCATINYAIGQALSGNTIYVAQGIYTSTITDTEVVLINKSRGLYT